MVLFRDTVTAYHKENITQDDGSTSQRRAEVPFVDKIACQISYNGDDKGTPRGHDRIPQERGLKVFVYLRDMPTGAEFKRGDYVILNRDDGSHIVAKHEGTIGEPRIYTRGIAHIEFALEAQT